MDALSSAEISQFEGFRLDRRGGVVFRRDERGVFCSIGDWLECPRDSRCAGRAPGDLVSRDELWRPSGRERLSKAPT